VKDGKITNIPAAVVGLEFPAPRVMWATSGQTYFFLTPEVKHSIGDHGGRLMLHSIMEYLNT
jgi:hypothetical protein